MIPGSVPSCAARRASPAPPGDKCSGTTSTNCSASRTEELRRLAFAIRRGDPGLTLNPTALVNEAWVKMARSAPFEATSVLHFKRIAGRAMRQLLVESARRRRTGKRGGGDLVVTFDEALHTPAHTADDVIALDEALAVLATLSPRQAEVVEHRYFAGLDIPGTAQLLGISEATVLRDWRAAKAWLGAELRRRTP